MNTTRSISALGLASALVVGGLIFGAAPASAGGKPSLIESASFGDYSESCVDGTTVGSGPLTATAYFADGIAFGAAEFTLLIDGTEVDSDIVQTGENLESVSISYDLALFGPLDASSVTFIVSDPDSGEEINLNEYTSSVGSVCGGDNPDPEIPDTGNPDTGVVTPPVAEDTTPNAPFRPTYGIESAPQPSPALGIGLLVVVGTALWTVIATRRRADARS